MPHIHHARWSPSAAAPTSRRWALVAAALVACDPAGGRDTTPPSVPVGVLVSATSTSELGVYWSPSTDDVEVVGYDVLRDGAMIASPLTNAYADGGLTAGTRHCYVVIARDAAGNTSDPSAEACGSTAWNVTVAEAGNAEFGYFMGIGASVAVDAANRVAVAHLQDRAGLGMEVHLTRLTETTWTTESIQGISAGTFSHPEIAFDAGNHVILVFGAEGWGMVPGLRYVQPPGYDPGTDVETPATQPSLALDTNDHAHVAAYDPAGGDLWYITNTSGAWEQQLVDDEGDVGVHPSLALDDAGHAHISYHAAGSAGELRYATNASGAWVVTTVDDDGYVGDDSAIGVGPDGAVHISYRDLANGDLKVATQEAGAWSTTTVDSQGEVGFWTDLVVDDDGGVVVSYHDATEGDLKVATYSSGAWEVTAVDTEGDVGAYSAIALDAAGRVIIAYADATTGSLKVADNR